MKETMLTYIEQEFEVNKNILNSRYENLNEFLKFIENKKYERWVILATGSSANAAECAKYYIENLLNINIEIKMPFLFSNYSTKIEKDTLYIIVTQGGHSFSTIEALKKVSKETCNVVTLTADLNSPVCKDSKVIVDIGCGKEKVGYVTKGFSATVLTFMLMGLELSYKNKIINERKYNNELKKLQEAILNIEMVIEKSFKWYETNKKELVRGERFISIGYGPGYGVVREADTKITETVRRPMNGHELEEYMHGPYLSLSSDDYIIFIETESSLQFRQKALSNYLYNYTKNIYTITYKEFSENKNDLTLGIKIDEMISPLLFVIPIQILSYNLAEDKGNDLNKKIFADFDDKLKSKI